MLSSMETQVGLTITGPGGELLRIPRSHPAFAAGCGIVRDATPGEQQWARLCDLMANPLKALVNWCASFGLSLVDEGANLRLQDTLLQRDHWLPLLQRCHATGGSPQPVMLLAQQFVGPQANVKNVCLQLRESALRGKHVAVVATRLLPPTARMGDLVDASSTGDTPFLVSFDKFYLHTDNELQMTEGMVLGPVTDEALTNDVLQQPVILGFHQTYRCESGSPDGWEEDYSFDSLKAAIRNAKDIEKFGSEARIINRITGNVVAH